MKNEIDILNSLLENNQLEPYIKYIRFPKYKNLANNTKINFNFPITALIGMNGTNKSSILRALYGSPNHYNLGNLWFETGIDKIDSNNNEPNCFIYAYDIPDCHYKNAEVIKTRIKKGNDPDYWEPSRPLRKYNMVPPPAETQSEYRSLTRWNPINKQVVYIDFREALSAYDKFFYHGKIRTSRENNEKNRKDLIRRRSRYLKKCAEENKTSHIWSRHERIINKTNELLNDEALSVISNILGRNYAEIRRINHSYYDCDGYTCFIKYNNLEYTEAFSGSGEFAVIQLVSEILNATPKSLILLDEPETSLHPGAQENLIKFLYDQVKKNKHQIIISTHSPAIVRALPDNAIKVLTLNTNKNEVSLICQSSPPEQAFFHIGEPISDKLTIYVEDKLSKAIVKCAIDIEDDDIANLFDIRYVAGGKDVLWQNYVTLYATENYKNIIFLFDGDANPNKMHLRAENEIPESENGNLGNIIKEFTNQEIKFFYDSNNIHQKYEMQRKFIKWVKDHVNFLPDCCTPEEFIWNNMQQDNITSQFTDNNYKTRFEKLTRTLLNIPNRDPVTSEDIFTIQRQKLADLKNHEKIKDLHDYIMKLLHKFK